MHVYIYMMNLLRKKHIHSLYSYVLFICVHTKHITPLRLALSSSSAFSSWRSGGRGDTPAPLTFPGISASEKLWFTSRIWVFFLWDKQKNSRLWRTCFTQYFFLPIFPYILEIRPAIDRSHISISFFSVSILLTSLIPALSASSTSKFLYILPLFYHTHV